MYNSRRITKVFVLNHQIVLSLFVLIVSCEFDFPMLNSSFCEQIVWWMITISDARVKERTFVGVRRVELYGIPEGLSVGVRVFRIGLHVWGLCWWDHYLSVISVPVLDELTVVKLMPSKIFNHLRLATVYFLIIAGISHCNWLPLKMFAMCDEPKPESYIIVRDKIVSCCSVYWYLMEGCIC